MEMKLSVIYLFLFTTTILYIAMDLCIEAFHERTCESQKCHLHLNLQRNQSRAQSTYMHSREFYSLIYASKILCMAEIPNCIRICSDFIDAATADVHVCFALHFLAFLLFYSTVAIYAVSSENIFFVLIESLAIFASCRTKFFEFYHHFGHVKSLRPGKIVDSIYIIRMIYCVSRL